MYEVEFGGRNRWGEKIGEELEERGTRELKNRQHIGMEKIPNVSLCHAKLSTRTDQHFHNRLF